MINRLLSLTALSALAIFGVHADDQISEEQTSVLTDVQDGDENATDELIGRCPCRDKKDNPPTEESTITCGCDSEDEEAAIAHHGDESEHDQVIG